MRIPRCALGICMLYLHLIVAGKIGAEEGTRTPTPLRVHGPEPCASANSATSASDHNAGRPGRLEGRCYGIYSTGVMRGVKPRLSALGSWLFIVSMDECKFAEC